MKRWIVQALGVTLACLALVAVRVVWSSHTYYVEAHAAQAAGEGERAVLSLGRAARLYAPGNPWSARALRELMEEGARASRRGDRARALACYRQVRGAVMATRGVYSPNRALRVAADRQIAHLMAEEEGADPELAKETFAAREAWHLAALGRDEAPAVGWSLLALLGTGLLLGGAVQGIRRGMDAEGHLVRPAAARCGAVALLGFLLMLLGLWRA